MSNHEKSEELDIIPYVTTFNPYNPDIKQLTSILHRNEKLHRSFKDKVFVKSKCQPPNLKRLLTKAKFTSNLREEYKVKTCNEPRCSLCKHLMEGSSIDFKEKVFKVNDICPVRRKMLSTPYNAEAAMNNT